MTDTSTDENTGDESGLKAKNTELLGKLKSANTSIKTLEERLTALESDRDDALDTTKSEHEKALNKLQKALDKANGDLTARDARLGELLIDNAIKDAISTNKVLPQFAKAVEAMLRAGVKIENGEAVSADGTPLADANTAFFKSADAKHFVSAPANAGAGATGNTNTTSAGKWSKPPVTGLEIQEWGREAVADPATYNSIAQGWGRPDLEV